MTKMVATAAALQQQESGTLELDAPVEDYRPEFADLQVLEGFKRRRTAAADTEVSGDSRATDHQHRGLAYWCWSAAPVVRRESATATPNVLAGGNVVLTAPLLADPGSAFEYGINTDWLGKVVEAPAHGLGVAVKVGIAGPLGMGETAFLMDDEQRATSVPVHLKEGDGTWAPSDIELSQHSEWRPPSRTRSASWISWH